MAGYDDPIKESRRLPKIALRAGNAAADRWIVSQVFVEGRNDRLYYALINPTGDVYGWRLMVYRYSLKDDVIQGKMHHNWRCQDVSIAVGLQAFLREEAAAAEKYRPVEHLKGNYRDVVNAHGMYFADNNVLVSHGSSDANKPITQNVILRQGGIRKVYSLAAQKSRTGMPAINNWEDFYTYIVNAPNQGDDAKEEIKTLIDTLRYGQSFYQALTMSVAVDKDLLRGLRLVSTDVETRMNRLGYSAETREQVGRLVMMGPDPYQEHAEKKPHLNKKNKKNSSDPSV